MKKIIVPTGYMGSGSSAITDLISEYKNCSNKYKSFEYVFLHCPNGVFDLEDKLLNGNNALRSDEAIRSFEQEMNKLYNKKFYWVGNYKKIIGKEFDYETKRYINDLVDFNFDGYWYTHEDTNFKMFLKLCIRKLLRLLTLKKYKGKPILKYSDGIRNCFPTPTEFYEKTHKYIYNIISMIDDTNDNIILDQLLLPHNVFRVDNYFDDNLRVIIVERDPRDVYILNKYIWPQRNFTIPVPTEAEEFCKFYDKMRKSEKTTSSNKVLRVNFEDLVYNYDNIVKKIEKFLGFKSEEQVYAKKRFNPEISIKNTQLFRQKKYENEIKIIEKELKKYLYKFPFELDNKVEDTVEFE